MVLSGVSLVAGCRLVNVLAFFEGWSQQQQMHEREL